MMHYKRGTPAERLWPRMDKREDGCWIWTGGVTTDGYGAIAHPPHMVGLPRSTHRLAWTLTNGPIPDGLHVLHKCDVRRCCNPDHLFLGTAADNMIDAARKGRTFSPRGRQTHCKRGHELNEKNTRVTLGTYETLTGVKTMRKRACRKCHAMHEANRRQRIRAAEAAGS